MKRERIPKPLLVWGVATGIGFLASWTVPTVLMFDLYRSGAWTRGQFNVWGPILLFASVTITAVLSAVALAFILRKWRAVLRADDPPKEQAR